jgi:predicted Zn-dependent protease
MQRDYAQTLLPAAVPEAPPRPPGQIKYLRVRLYADLDYQAQTPRWQSHVEDQIDRANRVLDAQLGVRLQIESMRSWNRHDSLNGTARALQELAAHDSGSDVDSVIGFLSPLQVFSASHEQLGMAPLFSRHLVVRGISNAAEMDAIDRGLTALPRDERASLARERRMHKEAAIFLHEWAHTLGVFHDADPGSLMAPAYETSRSTFSARSIRLLEAALAHRNDATPEGRAAWEKVYRAELADETAAFDGEMREQALAAADAFFRNPSQQRQARSEPAPAPAERETEDALSDADLVTIAKVVRADDAGTPDRAGRLLAPVARAHPRNARVQQLACYLAVRQRPRATETARACQKAAVLPGASTEAVLLAAQSALATGDRKAAIAHLSRVETKLLADGKPMSSWVWAAQIYDGASTCSGAERALSHAPDAPVAPQILADCKRLRRLVALPATGVPVEREHEYVSVFQRAEQEALRGRSTEAMRSAHVLHESFPGTPGGAVLSCLVDGRTKPVEAARKSCEAARSAAPEAFLPRYVLGLLACAEGRYGDARVELKAALDIEDSTTTAWASLAAVHGKLGEDAAAADLAKRYRARFGDRLRPALWPSGWPKPSVSVAERPR